MDANAMTPDEPPSQPRKTSWKRWTLALACVLAIALAVLFLKPPARERVSVRYVGSTNYDGHRNLNFKGTNGLRRSIDYTAYVLLTRSNAVQTNISVFIGHGMIFNTAGPIGNFYFNPISGAGPGETFTFTVSAPPEGTDWEVVWSFWDAYHTPTHWEKARRGCYEFFLKHHMPILAKPFAGPNHMHFISSTDLHD